MQCGDEEKLIKKRLKPDDDPVYYVIIEDTYDAINHEHVATGHGGQERMAKEITKKHANINRELMDLFKSYCQESQRNAKIQELVMLQ